MGIGHIAIAGILEWTSSWRVIFAIYTCGILLCSLAAILLLREDPIYLFDVGKLGEAKRVIEELAVENGLSFEDSQKTGREVDFIFEEKMREIEAEGREVGKFELREVLKWEVLSSVLIIGLAGCFFSMSQKALELSLQTLHYSYNFNLLLVGCSNIFGFLAASNSALS